MGVTEEEMLELPRYRTSAAFSDRERAVLDLAVAMAQTPAEIPDELRQRLRNCFNEAQLVELTATVAWENYVARFNRAFGVESSGFSEGAFCALAEPAAR